MSKASVIAVLTGDIVESRKLPDTSLSTIFDTIQHTLDHVDSWQPGLVASRLDVFRGDGWQVALASPALALRAAILVRASLIAKSDVSGRRLLNRWDSRISIGIGSSARKMSPQNNAMSKTAYELSGLGLDHFGSQDRLGLIVDKDCQKGETPSPYPPAMATACDVIVSAWRPAHARVIAELLTSGADTTQADLGRRLKPPLSQQAVAQALKAGGWRGLQKCTAAIEADFMEWQ